MNIPLRRLVLGPVSLAGASALVLATPIAPDILKSRAALAASATASSESHAESGHGGVQSGSDSSAGATGAGGSAAADSSASAHNEPANSFVEGVADSSVSMRTRPAGPIPLRVTRRRTHRRPMVSPQPRSRARARIRASSAR